MTMFGDGDQESVKWVRLQKKFPFGSQLEDISEGLKLRKEIQSFLDVIDFR